MHLAEGVLEIRQAGLYAGLAAPFVAWSAKRLIQLRRSETAWEEKSLVSVGTALCFAMTVLPIPVPVVGVTSHLCATPLLSLFRGPIFMVLPVFLVLLVQALFYAHGGITTLGVNTLTLGIIGPLVTYGLIRALRRGGVGLMSSVGIACTLGDLAVYLADAAVLGASLGQHSFSIPIFRAALLGFIPIQGPLALLEGFLSAYIVRALTRKRPELIPSFLQEKQYVRVSSPGFHSDLVHLPNLQVNSRSLPVIMMMFLGLFRCSTSWAVTFRGLDDALFSHLAIQAGRVPTVATLDLATTFGPEVWQCLVSMSYLAAGFVIGRFWSGLHANLK